MDEGATGSRDEPGWQRHRDVLPRCPRGRELNLRMPFAHPLPSQVGGRERRGCSQQPRADVERFQKRAIHVCCVRGSRAGSNVR